MKYLVFVPLLIVLSIGCKKERSFDLNRWQMAVQSGDLQGPHFEEEWDNSMIFDKLIGKWAWIDCESYFAGLHNCFDPTEGLVLEFKPDSSLIIERRESKEDIVARWNVIQRNNPGYFMLELSEEVSEAEGYIFFYGEHLGFNFGIVDGANNFLYEKATNL